MVMEYWSGWFDVWGEPHHVFPAPGKESASSCLKVTQMNRPDLASKLTFCMTQCHYIYTCMNVWKTIHLACMILFLLSVCILMSDKFSLLWHVLCLDLFCYDRNDLYSARASGSWHLHQFLHVSWRNQLWIHERSCWLGNLQTTDEQLRFSSFNIHDHWDNVYYHSKVCSH